MVIRSVDDGDMEMDTRLIFESPVNNGLQDLIKGEKNLQLFISLRK